MIWILDQGVRNRLKQALDGLFFNADLFGFFISIINLVSF